ncbi:HNH endonuclease [Burkholderia gladioli]|uniref:HNH endonuclease n=1 Tax=Burkholderia gladioli TaxID=28095 RepID=UPI001FCA059A|nr:hypothetical protein [Burkholderia gladioli]
MSRLTKAQRERLRQKYAGRCAYCGTVLATRWHADHFDPVVRAVETKRSADGHWRLKTYGLVQETGAPVVFYFERLQAAAGHVFVAGTVDAGKTVLASDLLSASRFAGDPSSSQDVS